MKTRLMMILLALLALNGLSASAQVKYGGKVGLDLTNFWGKDIGHAMAFNFQAGLLMEYQFSHAFAVAPEVVFASQGSGKMKLYDAGWIGADPSADISYQTNYINVPVMLKYYATPAFSIDFGPQVGFNVYSKYSITGDDVINQVAQDNKDSTKAIDFGLGLGGTYNLTENAFVQARYTMGLTNTFKGDGDCKNGNIQLAFGMKF